MRHCRFEANAVMTGECSIGKIVASLVVMLAGVNEKNQQGAQVWQELRELMKESPRHVEVVFIEDKKTILMGSCSAVSTVIFCF